MYISLKLPGQPNTHFMWNLLEEGGGGENCINGPSDMIKMTAMPINLFLQNQNFNYIETWHEALGTWVFTQLM